MAYYINQGIKAKITAKGGMFVEGKEYTCTLYASTRDTEHRATTSAIAMQIGSNVACVFEFTQDQTSNLKVGSCILEVYDTIDREQMAFVNNFATVRANSLVAE